MDSEIGVASAASRTRGETWWRRSFSLVKAGDGQSPGLIEVSSAGRTPNEACKQAQPLLIDNDRLLAGPLPDF